jgi:phospholipase/carboxylesterase
MPRFFRRLAEGIFDEEDLIRRTHELADFIEQASSNTDLIGKICWRSVTRMAPT